MSWSRFQRDAQKPMKPASTTTRSRSLRSLTIPQALIVTAGMAGLLGLCGGAILRFAFANSPDARFLSPLQTFPALSDWDSELSEETVDAQDGSGDGYANESPNTDSNSAYSEGSQSESSILTSEPAGPVDGNQGSRIDESLDTQADKGSEPAQVKNFDAFAARGNGRQQTAEPLDLLKRGPDLSGTKSSTRSDIGSSSFDRTQQGSSSKEETYDGNLSGDIYDDSERYADELYQEDPYYGGDSYGDSYGGDSYGGDNYYPSTDESVGSNDAYYDQDQW